MARYAEWNKFIGNLKTDKYGNTTVNEVGIAFEKATADVVLKSEVDSLKVELEDRVYTINSLGEYLEKSKSEVERLEHILDCYALQYGTVTEQQEVIDKAKAEVAREIFEEIERNIINSNFEFMFVNKKYFAELKKKYAESENG